jgi:hypothetical protein
MVITAGGIITATIIGTVSIITIAAAGLPMFITAAKQGFTEIPIQNRQ